MERTTSARPFSLISELDLCFWLVNEDFSIAGQPERDDVVGEEGRYRGESEEWAGHWVLWKKWLMFGDKGCMQLHGAINRSERLQENCQYDLPSQ